MNPNVEAALWMILRDKLCSLEASTPLPVAMPDETFTVPQEDGLLLPFLAASDVRSDSETIDIARRVHVRQGTLILRLHWPLQRDISRTQLMQLAGEVAQNFDPSALRLAGYGTALRFVSLPVVGTPYPEGAYTQVPINVPWRTD